MSCTDCKKKIAIQEVEIINSSNFQLKGKISLTQLRLLNPILKVEEITNEIWITFLKENPNRISLFSEYPTNWKELITEVPEDKTPLSNNNKSKKMKGK